MVGIGYLPFFLSPLFFRGADFFRAAVLPAALRAVFFAPALRAAGFAAFRAAFFFGAAFASPADFAARDFLAGRRGRAVGSVSSTGSSSRPRAPASTSTTSDHST